MYNHFATLLANIDLVYTTSVRHAYVLGDSLADFLTTSSGEYILLDDYYSTIEPTKTSSPLINKDFLKIALPDPLKKFHEVIFPQGASDYYKQFLLYCYLRIVAASDKSEDIKKYDKRITYSLDELTDYFRFNKRSVPKPNNPNYNILVSGDLKPSQDVNYFLNSFVIKQIDQLQSLQIFSSIQFKYYKQGKPASLTAEGMDVPFNVTGSISDTIQIGDTGLSFNISGPFDSSDPDKSFAYTGNKLWTFTAEAPFNLNISQLLDDIYSHAGIVENMLAFAKDKCDYNYESMWSQHYNDVYRLAGLFLAYVERVNIVWQNTPM
jgi:hypothetical protein